MALSNYNFISPTSNNISLPTFLQGDFGRDFLEKFKEKAKEDYERPFELMAIKDEEEEEGAITGSNVYSVVLANQILRQIGLRTSTPADMEQILRNNDLEMDYFYVDTALVLRNKRASNEYFANDLIKQLGDQKLPVMIPLYGLDLRVDKNSPSGLAFNIREDAEIIYDKILNSAGGSFNSDDINKETGLPENFSGGDRNFNVRNLSGLSRFSFDEDWNISSDILELEDSASNGRIVVVKNL